MNRLISKFLTISNWSLPFKFLLSAALGALGGAGVLSYLVEYATYSYAISYGFRPPVEGIPYLKSTVTAGSLFLLLSGSLVAATILWSLSGIAKNGFNKSHPFSRFYFEIRTCSVSKFIWTLILINIVATLVIYTAITLVCNNIPSCRNDFRLKLSALPGSLIGISAVIMLKRFPKLVWWFSASYVALYYSLVIAFIFQPRIYAQFLRSTGFGGGIEVTLKLEEAKDKFELKEIAGFLMIRTSQVFIVYNIEKQIFEEYPLERIVQISYLTGGMSHLPHALPY